MGNSEPPPPPPPPPPPAVPASAGDYPAVLDIDRDESVHRWGPMFQWILAIPHFIVVGVLIWSGDRGPHLVVHNSFHRQDA